MAGVGIVGQIAHSGVVLQDDDPRTEGATYETVTFSAEDPAVAAVAAAPDDPLKCTVLLLAAGMTKVLCHVDPGAGEPFDLEVDVEARARTPGEATPVGSTFELGEFVEQTPQP